VGKGKAWVRKVRLAYDGPMLLIRMRFVDFKVFNKF